MENGRAERAARILELLRKRYPEPETMLDHGDAWQLLVATVLAAQCTDARVNTVTPGLFRRWPGPEQLKDAPLAELEEVVRPTGFYHNKAKNLIGAARRVSEAYGGEVPHTIAELVTIPGVARKTANVVLWGGFGINEGIAVDTHVKRLSFRLGLTENTEPVKIEPDLMMLFPREEWGDVNHRLVWFGRDVCHARRPDCDGCELNGLCPRCGVK
ncbi:MAG: endonuclease III [Mailhella sp.]|nr:endonuclease III [Mailhella sp.]